MIVHLVFLISVTSTDQRKIDRKYVISGRR